MYKGIMANDPSAYIATLVEREHLKRTRGIRKYLLNNLVRLVEGMGKLIKWAMPFILVVLRPEYSGRNWLIDIRYGVTLLKVVHVKQTA